MNSNEHILPIFLVDFINISIGKNNKVQGIFQQQFLENRIQFGWNMGID